MVNLRAAVRVVLATLSIVACNALVGIEDPIVVQPKATACVLNTDCPDASQVCLFQTCSPPCQGDRDCDNGARCLVTNAGRACVVSTSASCSKTEDCPLGSVCSGEACRNDCSGGCLADQQCGADMACHGSSAHDPSPASGGSGGSGGTTGTPGVAGEGGAAGSSTNGPVCEPGKKRCAGLVIETCIADAWTPTGDCPYACSDGACAGDCVPQTKGCEGLVPRTCTADSKWQNAAACAKVCEKGECVERCTEGTLQCSGGELTQCGANGAFALKENCAVDCVNEHCTECTPPAQECQNGQHRTCSQDGKWGTPFTCAFMCVGTDCGVCTPNPQPTECISNTPQYCDGTGNFKPAGAACTGATPLCEDGKCVECAKTAVDCLDANTARSCQGGKWTNGIDCKNPTPACLKGACVACAPGAIDCFDANTPRSCGANGAWKNGTDCSPSLPACLNGTCVQCAPNATPTRCASACTKTRQYCGPQGAWTDYATSCTGADSCSGGGCALAAESQAGQYAQLTGSINGWGDELLANRIQITCNSDLLRLGARFKIAAGQVRFALYKDNAGAPTSLVAATSNATVTVGLTESSASGATLAPGYYWVVMNLGDQNAEPYYLDNQAPGTTVYAAYTFSNIAFPTNFPTSVTLNHLYNLYAVVRANP